ncbi:uncharacterized protein K02A2.6-like [Ylistrum balloti]|uniref:uncharacterized protein K02A2.6-like n=1 Tax=Ylistrum balloti TaxID=509963 RepID=UPI002905CE9B|nr:uncharacterized protein K02A2.6-like [Ylistrum balloti]
MALERIPPPHTLNFNTKTVADDWTKWREEFLLFTELALKGAEEQEKLKMFKYILGSEGREIYKTLKWDVDEKEITVNIALEKFENYCKPKKNETVERFKFNVRKQGDETTDKFITDIKTLSKSCNFGELCDSLIRDKIVCGIRDTQLRERLLRTADLTLDKAEALCRTSEITKQSVNTLDGAMATVSVHKVTQHKKKSNVTTPVKRQQGQPCKFCGRLHEHKKEKCPAYGQSCRKCNSPNHFEIKCDELRKQRHSSSKTTNHVANKTKPKVNYVSDNSRHEEDYFELHTLTEENVHTVNVSRELRATLDIGGKQTLFQLDSGATCNIIPKELLPESTKLKLTTSILKMFNKTTVTPIGKCELEVLNPKTGACYKAKNCVTPLIGNKLMQDMELIKVQHENILSLKDTQTSTLTHNDITTRYSDVFEGIGKLEGKYHLVVDPTVPPVVHAPRKVPIALRDRLKAELDRLESMNVITPVTEPTAWVSSMVMVVKPEKIRICIDPKDLNKALKRSHYPLPTIEDILPQLHRAKVFSVLDARSGFWHVELDEESSLLTTFNTPYGRYRWLRMPFGISTAPEEYQRRQNQTVEGLPGVHSIVDDILVYGEGETEAEAIVDHDRKLLLLLDRCRERGLKLNKDKLKLRRKEVKFVGHLITADGLKPDPEKVKAVSEMPDPTDIAGVRRFIGFVNYLSKFMPGLSDKCEPLRKLTVQDAEWCWMDTHKKAMKEIKDLVNSKPVLKYFNPKEDLTLQCDASEKGLGAAIMQNGQPIAYASRALTDVETRYAQIEKELLAVVFGLEKFHHYVYGRFVLVQSDHKPLEMIIKKSIHSSPKRLQRMLLRLQKYDFNITYHPGKEMYLADTLSRAYLPISKDEEESTFLQDVESINMAQFMPIAEAKLREIQRETGKDDNLQILREVILEGWSEKRSLVPIQAQPYFNVRDELSLQNGIIFRGERAVIPFSLRRDIKAKIHSSHIGIEGCLRRARETVYWPGMNAEIREYIERCDVCRTFDAKQSKETLVSHEIPDRPWAKLGSDLFTFNNKEYLITVDYYSNYWEVDHLEDTKTSTVVHALRKQFARYGIPDTLVTDNGPQYSSDEFHQFTKDWSFEHITSSPGYPQSNGKSEQAVKTAKRLMQRALSSKTDPYLALLDFRNTPSQSMGSSPVQRLMNRRTKTLLPTKGSLLRPQVPENTTVTNQLKGVKERQAFYYNQGAKDLKPLETGQFVRIAPQERHKEWRKGVVQQEHKVV